jgi:serine/threonine-protein kinase
VPWVGVLILVFGVAVPMKPVRQLICGVLATATLVAWVLLSLVMVPIPVGLETAIEELTLAVLLSTVFPSLLCVGIGYMAARQVRQLSERLQEAHELGAYRLIEKLGRGGMGEVWRAQHEMLARPAAIKLLRDIRTDPDDPRTATLLERFEREVQATSQLRSPHTVEVYDYGFTAEGVFYYVMELLDGTDLADLVLATGPQPPARVIRILRQAASSLAEAHAQGLVHRDVKPANIMLCRVGLEEDFVKVLDFGLVKAAIGSEEGPTLTAEFSFAGTPAFAAPEVARKGATHATGQSDLYSLACVGYWLLTGHQVFPGGTPIQILAKHISDQPPPPSQYLSAPLPGDLEDLIMRCLAKDPQARPAGAVGFMAELERCIVPEPWNQAAARAWWLRHGARLRGVDPSEDTTV